MIKFILNDKEVEVSVPKGTVLLDYIRYNKHLTGTKIGCREGDCGACTVLVGEIFDGKLRYNSLTSCLTPLGNINGKHVVTIEGINNDSLNPVQQAMCDNAATQCGFCTPGFVMSLNGFCLSDEAPTHENVIAAIDGNICRCTGYKSIEKAAQDVCTLKASKTEGSSIDFSINKKIVPAYFKGIESRLLEMASTLLPVSQTKNQIVGGGTDLYVQKHAEMVEADIDFLFNEPPFNFITEENKDITIGSSVTVSDLLKSSIIQAAFPSFRQYAKLVSSTPIRNIATLAGNFANASPIGDFTIFFLALDAKLILSDNGVTRTLPLDQFYKGYKLLNKTKDEIIEAVIIAKPNIGSYFNFEKVSKRTHLDIASVNTAIWFELTANLVSKMRISAGGVGPIPMLLTKTAASFIGKEITVDLVISAIEIAQTEISPISDVRGVESYKRLLLGQLIKAHFITLLGASFSLKLA